MHLNSSSSWESKSRFSPLGKVLQKNDDLIELDPLLKYKEITVRLWGKGVILRGEKNGSEIVGKTRFRVRQNQFILSRIDARNGAFGLIPPELDCAVVSNDFPTFNVVESRLLPEYLGWLCRTRLFVARCAQASEGTTNRVRLKESEFYHIEIPLPSLSEQRRIVAKIEQLAAKVKEANFLHLQSANAIGALWKESLRTEFLRLRCNLIPLEKACAAIIDNLHSNPRCSETGIPCIRSSDVGWGTLNLNTAFKTDEAEYYKRTVRGEPKPHDIVLVREGGGTGKAAIVEPGQRFSLGQRVMMLRPDEHYVVPRFFLYQLLSPLIQEDQIVPLSKGSASPHLNIGALRRFPFRVPPISDQHRIVTCLDSLRTRLDQTKSLQIQTATGLDALLPIILDKAFRGEL